MMAEFTTDAEHSINLPVGDINLDGLLYLPQQAKGIILFAHGSGSSRLSPRNQYIARILQQAKFATLLFDLLTADEDKLDNQTLEYRFDIDLLASRLIHVTQWIGNNASLPILPIGYFGASTGGGAALLAAAKEGKKIKAVVSRGGRPDLAGNALNEVQAATLLIVGGNDSEVIKLNEQAYTELHCEKKMEIIAGASHLFEETGKLEIVANLAEKWFSRYLCSP